MTVGGADLDQQLLASSTATEGKLCRGHCKWYDASKGYGFVTPDDHSDDVFVYHSSIYKDGFRSLDDNEVVEFVYMISDKGRKAITVTGPNGCKCRGSRRKRRGNRRRDDRCYNCNEHGHYAKNCPQSQYVVLPQKRVQKTYGKVRRATGKAQRKQKRKVQDDALHPGDHFLVANKFFRGK